MTDHEFRSHDREPDERPEEAAGEDREPSGSAGGDSVGEGGPSAGAREEGEDDRRSGGSPGGRARGRGGWSDAFADVQEIVNDVVENVRGFPLTGSPYPRLDLYRVDEEGYRVYVDLPGVGKDEVEVTTVGDELTIEGERRRPARRGAEALRSERGYGHFRRSLRMPPDADPSSVRAEMHGGVLEIDLPRASQAESRKVEID